MRRIEKGPPPAELLQHQRTPGADYDGLVKHPLQERLCEVQHHLCCFCQSRIGPGGERMRIAHFVPRTSQPALELDWSNMWGACCGGEVRGDPGRPVKSRSENRYHCDKLQGSRAIHSRLDPGRYEEGTLRYHNDGRIDADDKAVNASVDGVLGLNLEHLKTWRRRAREAMVENIKTWSIHEIERKRRQLCDPDVSSWQPYVSYLQWYLDRKLRRMKNQ